MSWVSRWLPFWQSQTSDASQQPNLPTRLSWLLQQSQPVVKKFLEDKYQQKDSLGEIFQEEFWRDCKRIVEQVKAQEPDWDKWEYVLQVLSLAHSHLSEEERGIITELIQELSHLYNAKFLQLLQTKAYQSKYQKIVQQYYLETHTREQAKFLEVPGSLWTLVVDVEKSTQAALYGASSEVYQKVVRAPLELHQELVKQVGQENLLMGYAGDGAVYLINSEDIENIKNVIQNYQTYLLQTSEHIYLRAGLAKAHTLKRSLGKFFRITLTRESGSPSLESMASDRYSFLEEAMELLKDTDTQQDLEILLPSTQTQWEPDLSLVACPFEEIRPRKGYVFVTLMIKRTSLPSSLDTPQVQDLLSFVNKYSVNPLKSKTSLKEIAHKEVQVVLQNQWMPTKYLGKPFLRNSIQSQAQQQIDNLKLLEADTRLVQFPIRKVSDLVNKLEILEQKGILSFGIAVSQEPLEFACSFTGEKQRHHVSGKAWVSAVPGLEEPRQIGIFHAASLQLKASTEEEKQTLRKEQIEQVK
jgi:hypothetical protein